MNLSDFLKLANKYLDAKVDDDTIATVENIARETESPAAAAQIVAASLTNPGGLLGQQLASSLTYNNYLQAQGIESPLKKMLDEINAKTIETFRQKGLSPPGLMPPGLTSGLISPGLAEILREQQQGPFRTATERRLEQQKLKSS